MTRFPAWKVIDRQDRAGADCNVAAGLLDLPYDVVARSNPCWRNLRIDELEGGGPMAERGITSTCEPGSRYQWSLGPECRDFSGATVDWARAMLIFVEWRHVEPRRSRMLASQNQYSCS